MVRSVGLKVKCKNNLNITLQGLPMRCGSFSMRLNVHVDEVFALQILLFYELLLCLRKLSLVSMKKTFVCRAALFPMKLQLMTHPHPVPSIDGLKITCAIVQCND